MKQLTVFINHIIEKKEVIDDIPIAIKYYNKQQNCINTASLAVKLFLVCTLTLLLAGPSIF